MNEQSKDKVKDKAFIRNSGKITLVLLLLYIAFNFLTALLINPPSQTSTALIIGGAKSLPLMLFIPFILKKTNYKLYAWLCFLLILYYCWAVLNAFVPGIEGTVGMFECALVVLLFTSSMLSARWSR